jgi:hypothetical protein
MQRRNHKKYELRAHTIALTIAILGPLLNLILGFRYASGPPGMYFYWAICLLIYVFILIPFTYKSPLTLIRLIILGITVEDFASNTWHSLFLGSKFLPFYNWYTQFFPFLGTLGEPTPYLLIPKWYISAIILYSLLTITQFRRRIRWLIGRLRRESESVPTLR